MIDMNRLFALTLLGILIFGCISSPQDVPSDKPADCNEYCEKQVHAQCVGNWNISGTYPSCECSWICDQAGTEDDSDNGTQIANPAAVNCKEKDYDYDIRDSASGSAGYCSYGGKECEEWALYRMECCLKDSDCVNADCAGKGATCVNSKCVCKPEEASDTPEYTNKTIGEIIDERLEKVKTIYILQVNDSSTIDIKTYKWLYSGLNDSENIPVGNTGATHDVLFDSQNVESSRGFGCRIFNNLYTGKQEIRGVALFLSDSYVVQGLYEKGSRFDIQYRPISPDKKFRECAIDTRVQYISNSETWTVYYFTCVWLETIDDF